MILALLILSTYLAGALATWMFLDEHADVVREKIADFAPRGLELEAYVRLVVRGAIFAWPLLLFFFLQGRIQKLLSSTTPKTPTPPTEGPPS